MIYREKIKNGFGIVEVLIASVIMMIVIFALTAAGRSALRGTIYLHERAQAMYLAQEGIEQVRQVRDSNWLDALPATTFKQFTDYGVEYAGDSSKKWAIAYDGVAPAGFKITNDDGVKSNITIDGTVFNRTIIFKQILSADAIVPAYGDFTTNAKNQSVVKVTVKLEWQSNGREKNITVSELLTDWRPNY
jgi:type II secretory pathway pseudopilin PulG